MAIGPLLRGLPGQAWGAIRGIAARGQTVSQQIGQYIQQITGSARPPSPLDTSVIDQLAGFANGMEAAKQAVAAAEPGSPVTSDMIALAPWSADLNAYNAAPSWDIQLDIAIPGQEEPVYRILAGVQQLPDTVEQLQNLADVNLAGLTSAEGASPTLAGVQGATVTGITVTVGATRIASR